MFAKKEQAVVDYDSLVMGDFLGFMNRADDMVIDSTKLSRYLTMKTLEWDSDISEVRRELAKIRKDCDALSAKCAGMKRAFIDAVNEFRMKASMDDFKKLQQKVDRVKISELVTRDEFLRMLDSRL